jgi:hypothetical protein
VATPAFNDAADKIRREEAAADKAREAADAEKARETMRGRTVPEYSPLRAQYGERQQPEDEKGPTLENAPGAKEAEARMSEIERLRNSKKRSIYAEKPDKEDDALDAEWRRLHKQRFGRDYVK